MAGWIIILVIILVAIYFYGNTLRFGQYNTTAVAACPSCYAYQVHNEHDDQVAAAALITQIVGRCTKLMAFLKNKYQPAPQVADRDRTGRIDIVPVIYDPAYNYEETDEAIRERVKQLVQNFNPQDIREISPRNPDDLTSYTENKTSLILCLRRKTPDPDGTYPLHDINTMMFVTVHEMTHMMNNTWGHPLDFWELFRFMLINAQECGIYQPVDYSQTPIVYCGLTLDHNPYFHSSSQVVSEH